MTKGQVEAAITEALTRFEREHLGRGPKQARTHIIEDMVLVRLTGILSTAEKQLSTEPGGVELLKKVRSRLIEGSTEALNALVARTTGRTVISMHTDISSRTGERIFLFELDADLESLLEEEKT